MAGLIVAHKIILTVGYFLLCSTNWSLAVATDTDSLDTIAGYDNVKVCRGTSMGLTNIGTTEYRYEKYKINYTNCTYIMGNLEIVYLDGDQVYDLSFLSSVREITGYVLITANSINSIPLTNLRIIRGQSLYYHPANDEHYSLFVALNYDEQTKTGLRELGFTKLAEILRGKVYFQDNNKLCFENTINWKDINPHTQPPVQYKTSSKEPKRPCPQCHESCFNNITQTRHCWGEGPNQCQILTHGEVCHGNCGDNRCYGSQPNQCCHPACAGGCTGPKNTECFACSKLRDGEGCVNSCPPLYSYSQNDMRNVPNPDAKYAFGSVCVKKCPLHFLQDGPNCVITCGEGKNAESGMCKPCNGPCPKKCEGISEDHWLNSTNINNFTDCTLIQGNLRILHATFERDKYMNAPPLHPSNLTVLKNVREITGYLLIQSNHPEFTNLSFLSSLEVIQGRHTKSDFVVDIMMTRLKSLELTSLKQITNGNVQIVANSDLCYASTVNWTRLFRYPNQKAQFWSNRSPAACKADGETCDPQCDSNGCWGKGPMKCLQCTNFLYEELSMCLNRCTDMPRLYHKGEGKCAKCHEECENTCIGPNNTNCDRCAHVKMVGRDRIARCEPSCGNTMYPDENKICRPCHSYCANLGCTGPSEYVGEGGCDSCELGMTDPKTRKVRCVDPAIESCPDGFFMSNSLNFKPAFRVCDLCDYLCTKCTGATPNFCQECRFIRNDGYCVRECPSYYYPDMDLKECRECNHQCRGGCHGPTVADCMACANFKIYTSAGNGTFNCTKECPKSLPYKVRDNDDDENLIVCADNTHPEVQAMLAKDEAEDRNKLTIILGTSIPGVVLLMVFVCCVVYLCNKRAHNNMKAAEYTAKITGHEEIEPLTPTNAKPDLAKMRIINESELRRGAIIGSGAFGTVYKGIWIPQGENVKIPVAIKVLQDGTSPSQSTELLEEARVMCSVEHICCVRILAVCMASQMMLITQLMPHGNLLQYVRENSQYIGSKALLNWCTQIARGMAYLEERGIVHRDLAARNVLLQTPSQVKLTDFGLAKLLDSDTMVYHSQGGLMPIKWLALECIQHRIFTHKSDVWSFGITVWELFTLGKRPYEGVRTKDVPILLEKGERLQQPIICTIDVYMIMVKCWMLDADSRPSFKELVEEFAKMSRDPGRYLVIEGDEHRRIPESALSASDLELETMDGAPLAPPTGAEGDALMRLPSVSYDKNDLVHGITEGGPESVMEAEEYLQPVESNPHPLHSPHGSLPRSLDRQFSNQSAVSASSRFRDPHHHGSQNFSPHGAFKDGKGLRDGQKVREKKYGHLSAAARAKQERDRPRLRGDSVSSRYSSDPIKFTKDKDEIEWGVDMSERGGGPHYPHHNGGARSPKSLQYPPSPAIMFPVDKDNYLEPGAAAQSLSYLDLEGSGYYQNEKEMITEPDDPFSVETDQMLHQGSPHPSPATTRQHLPHQPHPNHNNNNNISHHPSIHPYSNQLSPKPTGVSVANPDYFENPEDEVWEPKYPMRNGYHAVPTAGSPIHGPNDTTSSNYTAMNGNINFSPLVNTKVTLHDKRLPSTESKV